MAERYPAVRVDVAAAALSLGRVIVDFLEAVPKPITDAGVSPARWRLLVALVAQSGPDGARMGELAEHLGVREPTVTATVDRAEAEGLVRRVRDVTDRRIVRVSMTPAGLELVGDVVPILARRLTMVVAALGGVEETDRMAGAIESAVAAIQDVERIGGSRS